MLLQTGMGQRRSSQRAAMGDVQMTLHEKPAGAKRLARSLTLFAVASIATIAATLPLSAQTRTLVAGSTGIQPPMNAVVDGQSVGALVDLLAALGAEIGFEVEHMADLAVGDTMPALLDGRIDISGGLYAKTPERVAGLAFTIPFFVQGEGLVVRADDATDYRGLEDLAGKRVGAVEGASYIGMLRNAPAGTYAEIVGFVSNAELLAAVEGGQIDGGLYGGLVATTDMASGRYPALRLADTYAPSAVQFYAFALRPDDTELLARINETLGEMMVDGRVQAIFAGHGVAWPVVIPE